MIIWQDAELTVSRCSGMMLGYASRAIASHVRARFARTRCSREISSLSLWTLPRYPTKGMVASVRPLSLRRFNQAVDNSSLTSMTVEESIVAQKEAALGNMLDRSPGRVSTDDYLDVLRSLAASKLPDAPLRAERWLHRLEQHAGDTSLEIRRGYFERPSYHKAMVIPTSECYQRVIEAWNGAISEDPARVVTRAERWLWKHIESPSLATRPDTACFNAFLDICTKGRALKNSHSNGSNMSLEHAQKAENVLRFMIGMRRKEGYNCRMSPDIDSFNLVIRGWTRCRKSIQIADRAMEALSLLEQYQASVDPTVRPDSKSYGMIMDAIAVRAKLKVKRSLSPLEKSSRSKPSENGLEEILLLNNMIDLFHEKRRGGDYSVGPNTFSYNILLTCWANLATLHEHAPGEAESILRNMTSLKEQGVHGVGPDCTSYLMVMKAWSNSRKPTRGQRVTWLLSKQWKEFHFVGDASLRPTVFSYNAAIQAWISLKEPLEAEKLLSELVQHSTEKHDSTAKPLQANSESYSLLIRAWLAVAENGSEEALFAAAKWLEQLEAAEATDSGISSSVELFTLFFAAARKCSSHSAQVLQVTLKVFNMLRASRHMIDCLHFSRLLQIGLLALSKPSFDESRAMFIYQVVSESKEAGLVSSAMLRALANGPTYIDGWTVEESKRIVEELLLTWPLQPSWTRNIRQVGQLPKESDLQRTSFSLAHHGVDPFLNVD
jgi:hypothetical protein